MASTHIQMWPHIKFEVYTLHGLAYSVWTNMKKKRILACFLRAKRPIFKLQKNQSLRHQPAYKCDIRAKFEVSALNGLAYSVRTNMKKWILTCFLRAKRPIFKLKKKSLFTASTHLQMWLACKMWGFYTERFGVQRADKQEKTDFGLFF